MTKQYTSEQFWKLYDKIPQELKDALFSNETGNNIYETCKHNKVVEHHESIIDYTGQVLLGVLPPEDFQKILIKNLGIQQDLANKIAREINRLIFYPVRPFLEELYRIEIMPSENKKGGELKSDIPKTKEKPAPIGPDTYREPIE